MANTFEELLELLLKNNIKFIVVGGLAVAMNGIVRTTDDVDILIDDSAENITLLLHALKSFGKGHASELSLEDFIDEEGAIRIIEAPNFLISNFLTVAQKGQTTESRHGWQ